MLRCKVTLIRLNTESRLIVYTDVSDEVHGNAELFCDELEQFIQEKYLGWQVKEASYILENKQ